LSKNGWDARGVYLHGRGCARVKRRTGNMRDRRERRGKKADLRLEISEEVKEGLEQKSS